jgi:hypothetical protein
MPSKHAEQHSHVKHRVGYSLKQMQNKGMNTHYINKAKKFQESTKLFSGYRNSSIQKMQNGLWQP